MPVHLWLSQSLLVCYHGALTVHVCDDVTNHLQKKGEKKSINNPSIAPLSVTRCQPMCRPNDIKFMCILYVVLT